MIAKTNLTQLDFASKKMQIARFNHTLGNVPIDFKSYVIWWVNTADSQLIIDMTTEFSISHITLNNFLFVDDGTI
jgi:hypothetical protein